MHVFFELGNGFQKITDLNQLVAVKILKDTFVQAGMRMIKMLALKADV
jgi:hypothetical protein